MRVLLQHAYRLFACVCTFAADTEKARESGVGFVHNTLLLDHPEKSCLSFPWRVAPKPVWHAVCDAFVSSVLESLCTKPV